MNRNDEDFDRFTFHKNSYEFITLTSIVQGMYNIMNKVKDNLEYFKTCDYVIKADVVQIIINKIDDLHHFYLLNYYFNFAFC
jgi:hypothetical protein